MRPGCWRKLRPGGNDVQVSLSGPRAPGGSPRREGGGYQEGPSSYLPDAASLEHLGALHGVHDVPLPYSSPSRTESRAWRGRVAVFRTRRSSPPVRYHPDSERFRPQGPRRRKRRLWDEQEDERKTGGKTKSDLQEERLHTLTGVENLL